MKLPLCVSFLAMRGSIFVHLKQIYLTIPRMTTTTPRQKKGNKILKYRKIKKMIQAEIDQSFESKNWDKAKNLCKRMDRLKNSTM
jgi:hypothetical protein